MKKKIINLTKNPFVKSVSTLAFGSVLAQIISVGGAFVLARIYDASAFGLLSLFTSLTTILAVITTGRYEYAVLLPEKDKDAKKIIHLIWAISFFVSCLFLIFIFIGRYLELGKFTELIHANVFFIFPIYTFSIAVFSSLQYWIQRKKNYKQISINILLQSIVNVLVAVVLGLLSFKYGLIFGIFSALVVTILFIFSFNKELLSLSSLHDIKAVAKKYSSFPKFMLLSDVAIAFSQQFVPIVFTSLFSSTIVGFYAMANRLLRLPSIVLTSSISDVFRNEAIERIRNHGNCTSLYFNTLKKLISIALPTFVVIYFVSPFAFSFFLGEQWKTSGIYAQILCIVLFFEFISYPLNSLFYIFEKQKIYMLIQVINSIASFALILLTYKLYHDVIFCIFAYCINSAIFNVILLVSTYQLSKKQI